jgi:hypothetical protein
MSEVRKPTPPLPDQLNRRLANRILFGVLGVAGAAIATGALVSKPHVEGGCNPTEVSQIAGDTGQEPRIFSIRP